MVAKKLYYTMGEVAEMFDVNASLIRHWESKFDCIRPRKNKKGNRLFSESDIERLKQIYHLVKERGMTLDGANKVMKTSSKENDLGRDTEMLERLQRIRAALVEVREELKLGVGEKIVESEVEPTVETNVEPAEETVVEPEQDVPEQLSETAAEQPKKRVVRRKKKGEEENKELFPFYEQSLF